MLFAILSVGAVLGIALTVSMHFRSIRCSISNISPNNTSTNSNHNTNINNSTASNLSNSSIDNGSFSINNCYTATASTKHLPPSAGGRSRRSFPFLFGSMRMPTAPPLVVHPLSHIIVEQPNAIDPLEGEYPCYVDSTSNAAADKDVFKVQYDRPRRLSSASTISVSSTILDTDDAATVLDVSLE
ncbi:hypothetical protein HK100_001989 [Physocladia obscura]|uniref:Uncharacterized protein n=1 Tax=Physocladia obscura TaxID=109957 RepID=A0AAD5XH95_9FUNG|nr:hypothetical protein HK100_001989 [Physocladia obscura]